MRIRRARVDEAAPIVDVWLRSRTAAAPEIPLPVHAEDEVRAWFADVVLPTKEVWIAETDGVVVGLVVLEDEWVDQLYVDPDQVGRGIGSQLIAVAKRERPEGLTLWTFAANTRARKFYESHGFVWVAETDGDNEEGAPDVCYKWSTDDADQTAP